MTPASRPDARPAGSSGRAFAIGRTHPPSLRDVADPETLDRVFKALANETRRGILAALHDLGGWMRSTDVAKRFDIPWQGVSRHLRILTEAGLLECQEQGTKRAYRLDRDQLRRVAGRWVLRVATEGRRDAEGNLVFEFAE